MKKNSTEIVFILDRSGSMAGLEDDTIGGFNSMIEKQKQEQGDAYVSTILFDNDCEVVHDRVDIQKVPPMTRKDYYVRGCTALLDAVGGAVHHISNIHKYARKEDIPEKTLFVITTDGMENASHRYDYQQVRRMIEQKKELGWEFLFLGANIDAAKEAGISAVIASDVAVMMYCQKVGQEVHLSTQLNISNIEALRFYAQFADVVVLARELRMEQVKEIHEQAIAENICGPSGKPIRIEMFCHGALCMAASVTSLCIMQTAAQTVENACRYAVAATRWKPMRAMLYIMLPTSRPATNSRLTINTSCHRKT